MQNLKRRRAEKVLIEDHHVYFLWKDGLESRLQFFGLRDACPCAECVNEMTGEKILDPATIRHDIQPSRTEYVGNYALRFHWNDGHDSGIYHFRLLRELSEQPST
jgi:ATP-binding protein involved in chromosome partitioning